MDLGVGSFVFSLGVVSALPLLRRTEPRPYLASVFSSIKKSLPIIALGLVRVIMVKGVDYPVRYPSHVWPKLLRKDLTILSANAGTRLGVWSTLELLLYDGTYSDIRYRSREVRYNDRHALDRFDRFSR